MPAPSSPASSPDLPEKDASALVDAVHDDAAHDDALHDDEQTDVMGRDELPDFEKGDVQEEVPKRPPQRPSTFTRLLLNPRR